MSLIPYGPWRPDVSDYNGQHTQRAENVIPRGDGYGPIPNLAEFTDALPGVCRGAFLALNSDGSISIFGATADALYLLDNTDLTWSNVSKSSGTFTYSLGTGQQWQFAQLGSVVLATHKNDALQAFTLGSSSYFADCAGSPPQASYISIVNEFVVLSGLASSPFRIQWSARSSSTGWTAGTDDSDFQDFVDGGTVRGVAGGESGIVLQDNAKRKMVFQPGSDVIFSFERIAEGTGLAAPLSLIKAGDRIFYWSPSGFQMMTPDGATTPIGAEKFDRTVRALLDTGSLHLFIGAYEPKSTRVFWAFKSTSGPEGLFDRILIYDFLLDRAALITGISGEFISSLAQPGLTLEGLDSLGYTLDTFPISFDDIVSGFSLQVSIASSNHKLGFLSGLALEATIETAELDGGSRTFVRAVRPATDAPAVYSALVTRGRLQATAAVGTESSINAIGYCPHRQDARLIKYRTRIPSGTSWTFAIGVDPEGTSTGQK